ncbi:MAG: hypothetical protein DHS20C10_03010 [marine bacterium B5-7]|nr:MAG: hypothetical protein DHS20C10_03010 [marine bacterium B5-7]
MPFGKKSPKPSPDKRRLTLLSGRLRSSSDSSFFRPSLQELVELRVNDATSLLKKISLAKRISGGPDSETPDAFLITISTTEHWLVKQEVSIQRVMQASPDRSVVLEGTCFDPSPDMFKQIWEACSAHMEIKSGSHSRSGTPSAVTLPRPGSGTSTSE